MEPQKNLSLLFSQETVIRNAQLVNLELNRRQEFNLRFGHYLSEFRRFQNIPIAAIEQEDFSKFGYESIIVYPDLQSIIEVCNFKIKEADEIVNQNEVDLIFSVLTDISKFSLSIRMFDLLIKTLERSRIERSFDRNILSSLERISDSNPIEMNFVTPSFPEVMNRILQHPKYFLNNFE
jgi:hypothetical protein